MKNKVIFLLQKLFGFENYLFVFALFIYVKLRWDKNEKDFFKIFDLIGKEGIVLDIGANIGVMSAHFARRLKQSTVFSFEPMPSNIKTFKRVVKFLKLKNVKLLECALSDHEGDIEMIMPVINSAKKQGLSHVVEKTNRNKETGDIFQVPLKKADNILELTETNLKLTAIKIDVEGHELQVLKGALNLIQKHRPIIYCELWSGEQRNEIIQYMKSLNYTPKIVTGNDLIDFSNQVTQNFYFIPV